jgi:hypothetical protein
VRAGEREWQRDSEPGAKADVLPLEICGGRFRGLGGPAFVNNEFGATTLQASHGEELCLPSS